MRISVRLFAGLRERAGADRVEVELPEGASVADLMAAMGLEPRSCIVALNREYAGADELVGPDDEVALVPPVSGGAPDADAAPAGEAAGGDQHGRSNGQHSSDKSGRRDDRPDRKEGRPRFDHKGDRKASDRSGGDRPERGAGRDAKPLDKPRSFGPKPGGRPARSSGYDPDSPFAALAVLRDRKPE